MNIQTPRPSAHQPWELMLPKNSNVLSLLAR
jgi:hypothetical protein